MCFVPSVESMFLERSVESMFLEKFWLEQLESVESMFLENDFCISLIHPREPPAKFGLQEICDDVTYVNILTIMISISLTRYDQSFRNIMRDPLIVYQFVDFLCFESDDLTSVRDSILTGR
ncbi:hypothetical protein ACJX0J_024677, partial [Zea mays]